MNARSDRWRRIAIKFSQHSSWVLPGTRSPWAEAMRRELDYIEDDRAALRWAIGCVMTSYAARLAALPLFRWRALSRPVLAGSMLLFMALAIGHAGDRTAPSPAAFEDTTCDLPDISPEIRPRLRCGTVRVPRDHARLDSGGFSLAVVVIKSEQQPALPDPIVYISGGPGNPLTLYAAYHARHPDAPHHDLILVDQRGSGRSEPSLCPELSHRLLEAPLAIAAGDSADAMAKHRAAAMACRDEATQRGIDLADFGTSVTVADLERVRQALGLERWNVFDLRSNR